MKWREIDTAPKDGTLILVFGLWAGEINGEKKLPKMALASWNGGDTDYAGFEWYVDGTDAYAAWMKPTHWMPLPEAPDA